MASVDHGGHTNGEEGYFFRIGRRSRGDEEPSGGQDHFAQLQSRGGAAAQGGFEANPRHAEKTALLASRVRAQIADQRKNAREMGTGEGEAESSGCGSGAASAAVSGYAGATGRSGGGVAGAAGEQSGAGDFQDN